MNHPNWAKAYQYLIGANIEVLLAREPGLSIEQLEYRARQSATRQIERGIRQHAESRKIVNQQFGVVPDSSEAERMAQQLTELKHSIAGDWSGGDKFKLRWRQDDAIIAESE